MCLVPQVALSSHYKISNCVGYLPRSPIIEYEAIETVKSKES